MEQGRDVGENVTEVQVPAAPTSMEGQVESHSPTLHSEDTLLQDAPHIPHFGRFTTSTSLMKFRVDAALGASMENLANGIPRGWWGNAGPSDQSFIPFASISAEQRRSRLMEASKAFAQDFPCAGPTCKLHCIVSPEAILPGNGPNKVEGLYTLGCWEPGHRSSTGTRIPSICPTKPWVMHITAEEKD